MAEPTERDRERARKFTARIVALDWGQEAEDELAQLLADERERAAGVSWANEEKSEIQEKRS